LSDADITTMLGTAEALSILRKFRPDAIILDVSDPSSFAVVDAARVRGVPVVAVTNLPMLAPVGVGVVRKRGMTNRQLHAELLRALQHGDQQQAFATAAGTKSRRIQTLQGDFASTS